MGAIDQRRKYTVEKTDEIRRLLSESEALVGEVACVCVTGSYGRLEASRYSDLDLFIVGRNKKTDGTTQGHVRILESELTRLNEICVKADLIATARSIGINDFDADGRYLVHYSVSQLVGMLGRPEDDSANTFTARLLMLLEGRPLIGQSAFGTAIDDIIASYWRDYEDHRNDFAPAFLSNDILRLWRTFCVNYEARTANTPHDKKLKRRVKNYKLKFSRLLTCYSALLQILRSYNVDGTVSPADMKTICSKTPIERIADLRADGRMSSAASELDLIIELYNEFLEVTDEPESNLLLKFDDQTKRSKLLSSSYAFADAIFRATTAIGGGSRMHRMLVV